MNFMKVNWSMVQHHGWSYEALENMIAWERMMYVMMTNAYVKEENERIKLQKQTGR